jgi:type II secretory pathway pseudopilin PulG
MNTASLAVQRRHPAKERGFSYALVLAAVVILGIVAEAAHLTTWRLLKADREQELLFRGNAYRRAIQSYYEAGTAIKQYPRSLDDLLKDPRTASGKRHIRALYRDPMNKDEKAEWTLIRAADGGISGVASQSKDEPLKQANFPKDFEKFAGAKSYADWVFEHQPSAVVPQIQRTPTTPASGPPVLKTN